ncbi:MAG: hypothetical protein II221_02045 [Paludibacteraceae bacterium]|nr:hypothetical protein [Paludibacteraceae bacterium]
MNYPEWLEIFLAICMGLALAGLGAWMFYTAAIKLIKGAIRLEDKRTNKETEALDCWKAAYDAEHEDHLNDVADLIGENSSLACENKRMKELLAKVKVKDL